MTDGSVLELLDNDAEQGMRLLMETYTPSVHTIVKNKLSYICTPEDVEEVVNDVFITFYNNRKKVDLSKGSIWAYLCTISKSKSVDKLRSVNRHRVLDYDEESLLTIPDAVNLQNDIERNELHHRLIKEINSLGQPDSSIVYARYFLGETASEIGKRLNMTDYNVRKHLSRALRKIERNFKEDYCYED